nr:probable cytosolic oligopeptidase A [Leptinotarsa decemlineata]
MNVAFCKKSWKMFRLLLSSSRFSRRNIPISNVSQRGYIVLIPEIGEEAPDSNIFISSDGLPEFKNILIENCMAAIAKQTLEFEEGVKKLDESLNANLSQDIFKEMFQPLERLTAPLDFTWGLSKTLYFGNNTLMPTSSYLAIHERARKARASKYTQSGIYNAVKFAKENGKKYSSEEVRLLQKFAIEGKLNGLELDARGKTILTEYTNTFNKLKEEFRRKTEISTKMFSHMVTDGTITRDFPVDLLKVTSTDPCYPMKGPWKLTLQPHVYMPAMEYCSDRQVRWNMWQALVGRGSNYGERELRTGLNLDEIRYIKRDIANILGYETYADMSMETKMAGKVSEVKNVISGLLERARPAQEEELKNLHEFAAQRGFQHEKLELWDVPYWKRKQQKSEFGYSDDELKKYFQLNVVLEGLFKLCEKLFDITIKQRPGISKWHKDVKFYDIFEAHTSAPVAGFYFDPYDRSEQRMKIENNGFMIGVQNRSILTERNPLAALIFNFDCPVDNKTPCLSFKEVKALFSKFGHALQHLLTRTNYLEVSGLSNIEWDAVEVSGHVLSHWLFDKDVMDSITSHHETGEKLPEKMYQSVLNVNKHMAGTDLSRELYLSSLDLELHSTKDFWLDIVKKLWPQYRCFPLHKIDSHPLSFSQIVCDEWGAAYYSHFWSRMIAADVYSAFHEVKGDEKKIVEVGKRYRNSFLALGGSVHSGQIFREFRGRDPSPKALLSSLGLKKIAPSQK